MYDVCKPQHIRLKTQNSMFLFCKNLIRYSDKSYLVSYDIMRNNEKEREKQSNDFELTALLMLLIAEPQNVRGNPLD